MEGSDLSEQAIQFTFRGLSRRGRLVRDESDLGTNPADYSVVRMRAILAILQVSTRGMGRTVFTSWGDLP